MKNLLSFPLMLVGLVMMLIYICLPEKTRDMYY